MCDDCAVTVATASEYGYHNHDTETRHFRGVGFNTFLDDFDKKLLKEVADNLSSHMEPDDADTHENRRCKAAVELLYRISK
jgi:ribosomal protein S15P/S13E